MQYFVAFGGFNLQKVSNVHDENGRDISEYDGVGAGKFNVPDARNPHTWKIECQLDEDPPAKAQSWRASEIFKAMDTLLDNSTQPSRLVITNSAYPAANTSVLAWLKTYSKDEAYEGVYDVTVELEEYKPVGVKTTNIPYVARPGKVPVPKKVTITKKNTVYKTTKKYRGSSNKSRVTYKNTKTGKPVINHAVIKNGDTYKPVVTAPQHAPQTVEEINPWVPTAQVSVKDQLKGIGDVAKGAAGLAKKAGSAIGKTYYGWMGKIYNWTKTLG